MCIFVDIDPYFTNARKYWIENFYNTTFENYNEYREWLMAQGAIIDSPAPHMRTQFSSEEQAIIFKLRWA